MDSPLFHDVSCYRRLVGRLIYLTITRPDLSYQVHILSQFMHKPKIANWQATLKVVHYIKATCGQSILLSSSKVDLASYSDIDWGSCKDSRQYLTGFCLTLGGSLMSWKCKKQHIISRSSTETEYCAMADTCCEITWMVSLLKELHVPTITHVTLYYDNKSALNIDSNPNFHERTKHIEIKFWKT